MTFAFRSLVDPEAGDTAALRIVTSADADLHVVIAELERWFDAEPDQHAIELVVDGERLGSVTRTRLLVHLSRPTRDPGTGDGATLPGRSGQYALLTYRCGVCQATAKLLFVDTTPECHGPMERVS